MNETFFVVLKWQFRLEHASNTEMSVNTPRHAGKCHKSTHLLTDISSVGGFTVGVPLQNGRVGILQVYLLPPML
jgi:hypothetical protein